MGCPLESTDNVFFLFAARFGSLALVWLKMHPERGCENLTYRT